jgi:hypothetical protein
MLMTMLHRLIAAALLAHFFAGPSPPSRKARSP